MNTIVRLSLIFFGALLIACSSNNGGGRTQGDEEKGPCEAENLVPANYDLCSGTLFSREASTEIQDPNSLIGVWESTEFFGQDEATRFIRRMEIRENQWTLAIKCIFTDGVIGYSEVKSPIEIIDNKLIVPETVSQTETNGVLGCTATISKTTEAEAQPFNVEDGIIYNEVDENQFDKKIAN